MSEYVGWMGGCDARVAAWASSACDIQVVAAGDEYDDEYDIV